MKNSGLPILESEGFVSKAEVARRVGKTVRTIDSWMHDGRLPFIKLGRSVLFRWVDVEQHIVEHYQVLRPKKSRARDTAARSIQA